MPSISNHHSSGTSKILGIGESGAGKSGSLAALAAEGFQLRIADFDNGLDILKPLLTNPNSIYVKKNPAAAENVQYCTMTDPYMNLGGKLVPKASTAWAKLANMMDRWKDGDVDLGPISSWGSNDIFVLDTITGAAGAAYNFNLSLNGKLGGKAAESGYEWQKQIGAAQTLVETLLKFLYSSEVKCNVIVFSHIVKTTDDGSTLKDDDKTNIALAKGFPSAIGKALSPRIPRYFNSMLLYKSEGFGPSAKQKIFTKTDGVVNTKTTNPITVKPSYDIEWGLAEYFKAVRG